MMASNDDVCTLLAMTPAGESLLVQQRGRISLVNYTSRGRQRQDASLEDVETAVRRYGWVRVDRDFPGWEALDEFRVHAAREALRRFPDTDVRDFSRRDVRVILKQVRRGGAERRVSADQLLIDLLLKCRLVHDDDELRAEIGDVLAELRRTAAPPTRERMLPARIQDQINRRSLAYGIPASNDQNLWMSLGRAA